MDLLPKPKQRTRQDGSFVPGLGCQIMLAPETAPGARLYAGMLRRAFADYAGLELDLNRGAARTGDIALTLDPALAADHYRLTVAPAGVTLAAGGDEALCNGVQTLCQLVQNHGAALPAQQILDWPDMANRGYYFDCSRGRVTTLAYLKTVADRLCRYKVNQWQLYIEHTYLFRDLSEAWRDDTPLTAAEILELDEYCAARHIELVPSLASFGHMYKILSTKTCCDLCELEDSEKIPFTYTYAGWHHTLNAANPDSLDFVIRLIDEYRSLFRTNKFNICDDETFDLGKGRSRDLAEKEGVQALYVRHVKALCEHIVAGGGIPQFWGDIMWRFPESCRELPPETICLNWGYLPDQRENEIRDIAASGITQYACPGCCGWNCWMPLLDYAYRNNRVMCHHARKYGAVGLLNTDWGDYGHINDPRLTIPGLLYGAAFAWNADPVPFEEINEAVSRLEWNDATGTLVGAMAALAHHEVFDWQHAVNWIESDDARRAELLAELDLTAVAGANAAVAEARAAALAAGPGMPVGQRDILQLICVVADGITLWNDIGAYLGTAPAPGTGEGPALAARLEHWFYRYRREWDKTSRQSGMPNLIRLMNAWADCLRGRAYGTVHVPGLRN